MKDSGCPKCASQAIMAGLEVVDRGRQGAYTLRVHVVEPEPPEHGFFWAQGETFGEVRAWICGACGYTELYTDNIAALYESYRKGHP
jgi:predicted nucleic-acid-binding Zn-ribbon protein